MFPHGAEPWLPSLVLTGNKTSMFVFYLHQLCVCSQNNSKHKWILMTFSGNADNWPRKSSLNFDDVLDFIFDQQRIKARGLGFNPNTYCHQIANIKGILGKTEENTSTPDNRLQAC